jgi:hypothetical protein
MFGIGTSVGWVFDFADNHQSSFQRTDPSLREGMWVQLYPRLERTGGSHERKLIQPTSFVASCFEFVENNWWW